MANLHSLCLGLFISLSLCILPYLAYYVSAQDSIGPGDETGEELETFLNNLKKHSGLTPYDETQRHTVTNVNCDAQGYASCIINANGAIIWELRMELYKTQMAQNKGDGEPSLDGCLSNSKSATEYNECMATVRASMIDSLSNFDEKFREALSGCDPDILQANCIAP